MLTGANDYEPTANSDIAILTAGFPRKPGMSRDDLLLANYDVVRTATEQVAKYSPKLHPDRGYGTMRPRRPRWRWRNRF